MAFEKIIAMFPTPAALEHGKTELIRAGLATEGTIRVEQEILIEDLYPPKKGRTVLERLKELLPFDTKETTSEEGNDKRHENLILVVMACPGQAAEVREMLLKDDAIDMTPWIENSWSLGLSGVNQPTPDGHVMREPIQ